MKLISQNPQFKLLFGDVLHQYPNVTAFDLDYLCHPLDTANLKNHICLAQGLDSIEMVKKVVSNQCHAFIHIENPDFQKSTQRSAAICETPRAFFESPENVLFQNPEAQWVKVEFENTSDKFNVLSEIEKYCQILNSAFLTESIIVIFEEFFMNAIFDAAKEAGKLDECRKAELFLGHDGESLVISCLDRFGSLKPEKMLKRILIVDQLGASQAMNMDSSVGGAGIGSNIVFNSSASLIFGVIPNEMTRVCCVIPMKTSRKKFDQYKKNIQLVTV